MTSLRAIVAAGLVVLSFGIAVAKLPAPPPLTEEQKVAAEAAKAKSAAAAAAANAQLAKAQDDVVARYKAEQAAKTGQAPMAAPAAEPAKN